MGGAPGVRYAGRMDHAQLGPLVRQHALTSALLGVDFVPAYRREGAAAIEIEAKPAPGEPNAADARTQTGLVFAPPDPAAAKPADREASQRALDALRAKYEADAPHQHFVTAHTRVVFGEGDPCARLMFVGEAPGAEEDRTGRPFVGRAGQLLDRMIAAMGLEREQVYIGNVLKTRPPNNATPTTDEIKLCCPYLFEQIRIIAPEAIVALGLPASRALLDTMESMTRLRGRWFEFATSDGRRIPVMPTYHPAFLLRSYTPENRAKVWSDLRQVMDLLGLKQLEH